MKIRRNKDGQQNLRDLRKLVELDENLSVVRFGGNWQVNRLVGNTWHITTCPWYHKERQALQSALYQEVESKEEASYNAKLRK